jgi:uncharacterized protein YacL
MRAGVLTEGRRGTATLEEFLADVTVHDTLTRSDKVASMEGIAVADASVILLAEDDEESLLANDKGLIEVAHGHGVECWWVTTLLLSCIKNGNLTADETTARRRADGRPARGFPG